MNALMLRITKLLSPPMRAPLIVGGLAALLLWACGGGGSSGSTSTTGSTASTSGLTGTTGCTSVVAMSALKSQLRAGINGNVFVPDSSVERASDAGLRAHTNYLIRLPINRSGGPTGMSPDQLRTAYGIPPNAGSGAVAVVDAYDYPTALADFNTFSQQFGLPTESSGNATSSSNSVFQVVYGNGSKPNTNAAWAQEAALDIEWAHAMAPRAKIYLVEANTADLPDLFNSVAAAAALPGVRQVVMSFGSTEDCSVYNSYNGDLSHAGVAFFAAAGDTAGERDYPALSVNAVAVGGTTLNTNPNGTWISETVWDNNLGGTGCGPSSFEPRPAFQNVVQNLVGNFRAACDIAADGDPNTGVSVYDSTPYQGVGWFVFGGTSAATTIIGGIANAAGTSASSQGLNSTLYGNLGTSAFHDITVGASGGFNATAGWDFPTGVGTPNGTGGF